MYRLLLIPSLFFIAGLGFARDPAALRQSYLKMQESYTQNADQLEAEYTEIQRQEVNRFIIALVRTEQTFRDEGDLNGVLRTRQLQEEMLETQQLPGAQGDFPEKIQNLLQDVRLSLEASRQEIQNRLDDLNRSFAARIEPVMRDLTRAGDFEIAREMLDIRNQVFASLDVQQRLRPTHRTVDQLRAPNDPNIFPISLEPPNLRNHSTLIARPTQIQFQPRTEGRVETTDRGFAFQGGQLTIPAHATEALLHQIQQTQSFTLEIGFQASLPNLQAPILSFGETSETSNLAILQENQNLTLLLRTTNQQGKSVLNRVDLGPVNAGRMQHLVITYRPGDLAIYRNGANVRRNRNDASGELRIWEMQPVRLGHLPASNLGNSNPGWSGTIVNLYIHATPGSSRMITTSFERFVSFISSR